MTRNLLIVLFLTLMLGMFSTILALDMLFDQPYYDGGTAATSAVDTALNIDYLCADNFSGLDGSIQEFIFYGLTLKFVGGSWQVQVPAAIEPFNIRIYDLDVELADGLYAETTGTYTVELYDDYGDGWNGGLLTVYVNDTAVLTNIYLPTGTGPGIHTFNVVEGDNIWTVYVAGDWAYEDYYRILDNNGVMIAEDGGTMADPGASTPTGIPQGGEPLVLEPNWAAPAHTFLNVNANVLNVGSVWGGAYQLYKFTAELPEAVDMDAGWISAQINADQGSGTWFLWLNSQAGDMMAYQYNAGARAGRDTIDLSHITADGNSSFNRDLLAYDLAMELWGGEVDYDSPLPAHSPIPADGAVDVPLDTNIGWTYTADPEYADPIGFKVNMWVGDTSGDPYQAYVPGGPGEYEFEEHPFIFDYETTYFWQVIPTTLPPAGRGDAANCPIWSFTTLDHPGFNPPRNLTFEVMNQTDVHLAWEAPENGEGVIEELIYDNDGNYTGAYSYNGYTMATRMSPQEACQILTLRIFTTGSPGFNAEVYNWLGAQPGTTMLFQEYTTSLDNEWVDVDVSGENLFVDGDFMVGFGSINGTTYLGYDGGLNNGRSWDYNATTQTWDTWNEAYLIRAVVMYPGGLREELAPVTSLDVTIPEYQATEKSSIDISGTSTPNPLRNAQLLGYKIYRDGVMVGETDAATLMFQETILVSGNYEYYVTALYDEGESGPSNVVNVPIVTSADDVTTPLLVTALNRNYPNPFNPDTNISFSLQSSGPVTLEIYNSRGQLVKSLVNGYMEAGEHRVNWNGRDDNDKDVSSGIYFYRMKSGNFSSSKKMILMK